MAQQTGTLDIQGLIATNDQSAAAFGLDRIREVLDEDLAVHNDIVRTNVSELADVTTDVQRLTGVSTAGEMVDADEYTRAPTQRGPLPSQVAFPMALTQYAIGWTRQYFKRATPKDVALAFLGAQKAHLQAITKRMKRAIFGSANYVFIDELVNKIQFTARRFLNADGSAIPDGPNGETFNANTHTHYLAVNGLTAVAATSLINTVVEHGFSQRVRVYINQADLAAWQALTGFTAYVDARIQLATNVNQAIERLDITRLDNRAVGIFGAAEIWTKPWMIANYAFAFAAESAAKPLAIREDPNEPSLNLTLAAEIDMYPLHAEYMEATYGVAVNTRANGAVLYTGGASYVDPVIS